MAILEKGQARIVRYQINVPHIQQKHSLVSTENVCVYRLFSDQDQLYSGETTLFMQYWLSNLEAAHSQVVFITGVSSEAQNSERNWSRSQSGQC